MCNYRHTKAEAFSAISAIGFSERMKRGQKNIRVKRKTKRFKRGNWLGYHFPCDRRNSEQTRGVSSGEAEEFSEIKG